MRDVQDRDGGGRVFDDYHMGVLLGIVTGLGSFCVALVFNVGPTPLGQVTGAAWAWGVGAATVLWWMPWVKQAFSTEVSPDGDA